MKIVNFIFPIILVTIISGCEDIIVKPATSNQNIEDFEAAWYRVNEVYPYLEFKRIDWDSIYTIYRSRAELARGDEFYLVLRDMLAELKDGHAHYGTKGGWMVYPYYPRRYFKDRHSYSPFVVRKYFDKEPQISPSGVIEYGIIPGNIGYAFLSDFHHNYLVNDFPGVLEYLENTRGLILDIRQKRGGISQNIRAVVTRFLTEPLEKPKSYWLGFDDTGPPLEPLPFLVEK